METLTLITQIAAAITAITSALIVIAKPIRNKLMGIDDIREGQKCTLRAAMLRTYYKHCETRTIRQYEKENFIFMYKAYKRLGGNSFIDDIHKEVSSWHVVS